MVVGLQIAIVNSSPSVPLCVSADGGLAKASPEKAQPQVQSCLPMKSQEANFSPGKDIHGQDTSEDMMQPSTVWYNSLGAMLDCKYGL